MHAMVNFQTASTAGSPCDSRRVAASEVYGVLEHPVLLDALHLEVLLHVLR